MNKSFKQIVSQINLFADNHKGIKQFESKPLSEYTANNYLYPLMWLELTGIDYSRGEVQIALSAYMVDRLESNYDNFVTVISNTLKLCDDFSAYFNEYEEDFGFYFDNDSPISPVEYAFDDNVAGNKIDIIVHVALNRDRGEVAI